MGSFTHQTMEQCDVDNDDPCIEHHVVTGVNALNVSETDGTELLLIVWQDGDPVLRHPFSLRPDDDSGGSGKIHIVIQSCFSSFTEQ